ncbi:MAG: HAMP domain-containing protein [Methylobacillus sp.]|jgi:two-component system osmolarity sensor histidine kinase EnvZ|nr:HAMP domain-containing protein [Methylobacillus sp.]
MKWLPRTLLSRIMLLIAFLLMASQYAAFKLYEYVEREPRAAAAALQAASTVNLTRAALLAAHEDRRVQLLSELSQTEGVRVYPIADFEVAEALPEDPLIQLIAEKIVAQLGEGTVVSVNHFGLPGLWVSFSIDDDFYWVVIPKIRTELPAPWQWVEWGALMLALALLGAYVIAARINRPLHRLAQAADQVARGLKAEPLPEYGAEELRRVSRTFNEMTDTLARLDSERTLLLAGVSHDLRTPLARLRLAVEMLSASDTMKTGMIQDIEDMDGIIRQFLDFIRGLEGETEHREDLNELIRATAERYARGGKLLRLNLENLPRLMLRPLAMQRLLGNLIDNAFIYGGKNVEIVTRNASGTITLSVLDNGSGIPDHEMPRLLRPFERMNTARGQDGGSGLGLAIADRIARMHGGHLTLHNRESGGLEVRITLPGR